MTPELSLVSIIIPTYNRAHLIGETLDTVLVQTYQNWECIIVDDGSTDNTDEVMESYTAMDHRIQFHHRPKDRLKGANACRNYGFEISKGEFINWFDSDDLMLNEFIEKKLENFTSKAEMVISNGLVVDQDLKQFDVLKLSETINLYKDFMLWKIQIITNSVMFKKDYLNSKNLFNNKIKRGQETEFFSRLFYEVSQDDYKILNRQLFLYRQHKDTKSFRYNIYKPSYKMSQAIIWTDNFKRSFLLKDSELIQFFYKILVKLFFNAISHKDHKTACLALRGLYQNLYVKNQFLSIQWFVFGHLIGISGLQNKRLETYFRAKKLSFE